MKHSITFPNKGKLDFYDFYFNEIKQEVARPYIEPHFIGHGTAGETFDSFKATHENFDFTHKLLRFRWNFPVSSRRELKLRVSQNKEF